MDTSNICLADPELKANPYPLYARLRTEAPVCRVIGKTTRLWLVTRYDDVQNVLRDPRFANDRRNAPVETTLQFRVLHRLFGPLIDHMLATDEPDHTRLRSLVQKAFTPKRVEELRPRVEALTEELLDKALRKQRWDVVSDFALPLPTTIIAEMLGIPPEDRPKFQKWSDTLLLASATTWKGMIKNVPMFMAFMRYIRGQIRERRKRPTDDLIGALVQAEEAGDRLTEDELLSMVLLLLVAGYETTVNLIGNGVLALLENPAQLEWLLKDPSLVPVAVEEFASYYTPIDYTNSRFTRCDVELAGVTIPAGQLMFAAISSANRDEAKFVDAERLNITRDPNRHLAFGHGIHFCLGVFLARIEAQIAFATLVRRWPDLQLAVPRESLEWRKSLLLRGLESLPVKSSARSIARSA